MIRHVAAIAVAICLTPSWLSAQSAEFTVNAASASVHKSPSTGSPVIGKTSRGAVLRVTRELGSWVRISWPAAPDGVGYVHTSTGWMARITAPGSNRSAAAPNSSTSATSGMASASAPASALRPASDTSTPVATAIRSERTAAPADQSALITSSSMAPTAHSIGFGGRIGGSTLGVGASARTAVGDRFGVQVEVSRYALTSAVSQQRLTSLQFAPSVLFSLPDKLTDYGWVRPYVGAGLTVYRSTLSSAGAIPGESISDSRLGRQAFGGTEVSFAAVPRFTLSADYGYRWPQTPFENFELGGRGLSVSGHWYVK